MKISRRLFPLLVCLVSVAAAFSQVPPRIVAKVVVEGNRQYGQAIITHAAKLKPGDLISDARLRQAFRDIWKTGFFDDVTVSTEETPKGMVVHISVVEKPIVRNVEFRGNKSITRSTIDDKLKELSITLPADSPLDMKRLKDIEEVIRKLAKGKGYRFAKIALKLEDVTPGVVKAVFQIDEGTKVRINDIKFTGNEVFSHTRLKWTMKKTREHWFLSWLTSHDILNEATLDEDLTRVRDLYLNHGYIEVRIGAPKIEVFDWKVTRKGKVKRRINIEIPLTEGDPYTVGKITVSGNKEFTTEELLDKVLLRERKTYSKEQLVAGRDAINEAYGSKGYYKVFTNPELDPHRETHTVDINLAITEDKIYTVRSFEFKGNDATQDKVLRRELLLEEGEVFDTTRFRDSLLKVRQLGYFTIKEGPDINEVPGTNEVDVLIKGEETGRNQINVGGGYSGTLGFFGTLSFSTRNFLGRGESLSVQAQTGARTNTYSLSFAEPWIFDKPYFASADVFKRRSDFFDFRRDGRGADAMFGSRIGRFASWRVRYSYEKVNVRERFSGDVAVSAGPPPINAPPTEDDLRRDRLFNSSGTTSSITPVFSFNTVDNPYEPANGLRFRLSAEYAPPYLGGTFTFVKPQVEATYYRSLNRLGHIFASHLELGWVEPLAGTEVPVFERFFLGGERSIRGLELRSVSPIDSGGFRIGGNKMILLNEEYQIPIPKSPLKGVLFIDAGNAFDDDESFDVSNLRISAGFELRITLPVLGQPLRFIYGYNLNPREDEKKSDFQFTIGSSF